MTTFGVSKFTYSMIPKIGPPGARKALGKRLRQARVQMNKTIEEIAIEALIAPKKLKDIENGKVNFRILTLNKLCKGYKVSMEYLLGDTSPAQGPSARKPNLHSK